jgi:hypothetical protein
VIVGNEEEAVVALLHLYMLAHRPEIVAYMQPT